LMSAVRGETDIERPGADNWVYPTWVCHDLMAHGEPGNLRAFYDMRECVERRLAAVAG
jgi:hypothetical protein